MKNNDDVIYFNGCSFTYGIGIHELESECIKQRFSKTLCDRIGYAELNESVPGSCNQRIARRTAIDFTLHKPKLAIIVWSDQARFEIVEKTDVDYKWGSDAKQIRPSSIENHGRRRGMAFVTYYKDIASPERDSLYTLQNMLAVKNAADAAGIKCVQLQFRSEFSESLKRCMTTKNSKFTTTISQYMEILMRDELIVGLEDRTSFFSLCGAHRSLENLGDINFNVLSKIRGQEGHPNLNSHNLFADWLHEFLMSKNLI